MQAVWNSSSRLRKQSCRRDGFTLLELMIVVVIIVILMGLLLPAVNSVRRAARDAEVRKEISDLEQAITQFKLSFGIEPPSRITLFVSAAAWDTPAGKPSKGLIKQMWPRFDFSNCGGAAPIFASLPGSPTFIDMNGAECLVFFLGGMIDGSSGAFVGFAKDPAHPFDGTITNREGPFFAFKGAKSGSSFVGGRLVDLNNNGLPEYLDSLPQQTRPYLYFNGYAVTVATAADFPSDAPTPVPTWKNTDCLSIGSGIGMPHAYYVTFNATMSAASKAYKSPGFQIISPGADGQYGVGRQFNPDSTSGLYRFDRDNMTNFHPGRLGG